MGTQSKILDRFSSEIRSRIRQFMENPNADNWDDIAGLHLSPTCRTTIWQAILRLDPTFPQRGRIFDMNGNVEREWERIPSPLLVMRALKSAS